MGAHMHTYGSLTQSIYCFNSISSRRIRRRKKVAAVVPKAESSTSADVKPLLTVDPPRMKKGKIVLSDEQKKVLDMVVDKGLNIFFTGSAGSSARCAPRVR